MRQTYTRCWFHSKRYGPARGAGGGLWQRWRSDAVLGNESLGLGEVGRDAGRGGFHSKSNWTRPVAFGLTGVAGDEHVSGGSADV